ncbi:MAG: MerR family transcriptional regulator [Firmicutes bacterium]|nr:MerR family transcriptional regulator [Bacillota bacterium]
MKLQTANQVSKMLGVSTQMLRYYERIGLVESLRKEDYAYRVYDDENIKRLQQIVILRKLQIPIKQIKLILNNPDAATATEIFNSNISVLQNEITALETIKLALKIFVAKIEELAAVRLNLNLLTDDAVMELAEKLSLTQKNVKENVTMSELNKMIINLAHESLKLHNNKKPQRVIRNSTTGKIIESRVPKEILDRGVM